MTINRMSGGFGFIVSCDSCPEHLDLDDAETFHDVRAINEFLTKWRGQ